MSEKKEQKKPPDCLAKLKVDQATINNLLLLQERNREYYGFYKDGKLLEMRPGDSSSVEIELLPEDVECELHIHPDPRTPEIDFENHPTIEKKQKECAVRANRKRTDTVSPNDAVIAAQLRYKLGIANLVVSKNKITQYRLLDDEKFNTFKKQVKGKGRLTETKLAKAFNQKFDDLTEELQRQIYDENQDFSFCGHEEYWTKLQSEWVKFLDSIGIEVKPLEVEIKEEEEG